MKFTDFHNSELAEASKTRNPTRDFLRNNPVSPDEMAKPVKQMSVPELAAISDEALDNEYHYGRSTPGNTFGWQANLKSAAFAKQMIDKGVTDIEQISDAIHKGWNVTAQAFVQNPDQFDDTEKLKAAGKLEAKLQQRAKLMNIEYAQLPDDEQEKDRVVARALLQAIKGQQGVAEGGFDNASPMTKDTVKADRIRSLKNLIAIAKEQERQLRVQELELELKKLQGVAEARIETIHGSAYTIDPNKYYVWAWDNAVVLYGEYTDENDAELNLSKIERRATKRLGPAVKGRFEVASGKMLLRQYGNEQGVAEARHVKLQKMRELCESLEISGSEKTAILDRIAQKIKNIFDKGVYVAKQEGRELGSAVKTVASWKTSTPQQKQKAKDDLSDLGQFVLSAATSAFASKVVLGALISNAVADPAVAAVAGPVSDLAKHAVEHIISELGITGIASAAGAMGLVYIKKMLHDASSTSSGQRWDRMQTLKQRPDYKPMAGPKPGVLPEQQNSTVAEDYLDEK